MAAAQFAIAVGSYAVCYSTGAAPAWQNSPRRAAAGFWQQAAFLLRILQPHTGTREQRGNLCRVAGAWEQRHAQNAQKQELQATDGRSIGDPMGNVLAAPRQPAPGWIPNLGNAGSTCHGDGKLRGEEEEEEAAHTQASPSPARLSGRPTCCGQEGQEHRMRLEHDSRRAANHP